MNARRCRLLRLRWRIQTGRSPSPRQWRALKREYKRDPEMRRQLQRDCLSIERQLKAGRSEAQLVIDGVVVEGQVR